MRRLCLAPNPGLLAVVLGWAAAGFSTASHADCAAVVAAYERAAASGRYALVDAPTMQSEPKGAPFYVRIAGRGYIDAGKGLALNNSGGAQFEASELRRREQAGEARCERIGDGKVGADAATGWRIHGSGLGSAADVSDIHFWISKSNGMPLYHAIGSDRDGWRWVYGSEVADPNVK